MMLRRRAPRPAPVASSTWMPSSSGPRWRMAAFMRSMVPSPAPALVLAATAATYAYSSHKTKRYEATTQLFVQASALDQALLGADVSAQDPDRIAANVARLVRSIPVAQEASRRLGGGRSAQSLLG